MSRRRKILWGMAVVLAVVAIALAVRTYIHFRRIPGIYLAYGGTGYIVIEHEGWGRYRIKEAHLGDEMDWRISVTWPSLILQSQLRNERAQRMGLSPSDWQTVVVLDGSRTRRGNWDAIRYGEVMKWWSRPPAPQKPRFLERLAKKWQLRRKKPPPTPKPPPAGATTTRTPAGTKPAASAALHPPVADRLERRIPFLHRVDDRRVVDCFQFQGAGDSPAAYEKARSLLGDFREDLYVRTLYLGAASRNDDVEEVGRRINEWGADFDAADDPFAQAVFRKAQRWLRSRRLSAAGRNAYDFLRHVLTNATDLETQVSRMPEIMDFEAYIRPEAWWPGWSQWPADVPGILPSKVLHIVAVLKMFEGKRQESRQILVSVYRLGYLMNESSDLISTLVGTAIRSISCWGLEIYALNCCETEVEFRRFWNELDRLKRWQKPIRAEDLYSLDFSLSKFGSRVVRVSSQEAQTRFLSTDSHFDLIRMATVAKHRVVSKSAWPRNSKEFAPLLPKGLPRDPFSSATLRYRSDPSLFTCYSVGPDRRDNGGVVEYDPTNGTFSAGDIILRVPRKRRYPFPREGIRVSSIADLMRQFPNDLPADPFATRRGQPLGTTPTVSGGFYIYSYGPDVDQFRDVPFDKNHILDPPYDPTNGLVSNGDVYIWVPLRNGDAARGRN